MSTFSSIVNSGASFVVRDLWEQYIRPHSTVKESIKTSYAASLLIVLIGLFIGFNATSIAQIWDWIMMALGAGVVVPNVLRWYWWRLNGWGYSIGTLGGIILSLAALFYPALPVYIVFPSICLVSLVSSIIVSYYTQPVSDLILLDFYENVRPFGLWKPIKAKSNMPIKELKNVSESGRLALINVLLAMAAVNGFYLGPMYLVGHWYSFAIFWFLVSVVSIFVLKFTWYNHLPQVDD
jgi:solute:Na+ symporter, SSS family